MKKRRLVIISFLLVAVLAIGVGFAAVADTLNITGRAGFRPASIVNAEIANAIHFDTTYDIVKDYHELNEDVIPTFIAQTESDNAAAMTVAFNGVEGVSTYTATAIYKVTYDALDTNLPDVEVDAIASIKNGETPVENFTISATVAHKDAGVDGEVTDVDQVGAAGDPTTIAPGESVYVVVTVTYVQPTTPPTNVVSGNISVTLNFEAVGA